MTATTATAPTTTRRPAKASISCNLLLLAITGELSFGCDKTDRDETGTGTDRGTDGETNLDSSDDGATDSSDEPTGEDEGDTEDSDGGTNTDDGGACEPWEDFSCSTGIACQDPPNTTITEWCGPDGPFDENGCMRRRCQDDNDCRDGEICYAPVLCHPEACVSSSWMCEPNDDGDCVCGGSGDCADDPIYCIPAENLPC